MPELNRMHSHCTTTAGYNDLSAFRSQHLDLHAVGTCQGAIPQAFMHFHRLVYCSWCSRTLSSRYSSGLHPSCAPLARAASAAPQAQARIPPPLDGEVLANTTSNLASRSQPSLPSLEEVHTKRVPVIKFIPKQLRPMWAQCLSRALATTTCHYNDNLMLEANANVN